MFSRIARLLKNPKEEYPKVIPYLNSRIFFYQKKICEFFGVEKFSQPYPGHLRLLRHVDFKNGFFVECGANDGYCYDPTYYLEKFKGWTGILVEPLPKVFNRCLVNRKKSVIYNYALVSPEYAGKTVTICDCNAMSVIKGSFDGYEEWIKSGEEAQNMKSEELDVPARTIQSLIDDNFSQYGRRDIDLAVFDVEGYELEVIKGLDFNKNKPAYLLIEIHTDERKKEIEDYIGQFGYALLEEIENRDFIYKSSD